MFKEQQRDVYNQIGSENRDENRSENSIRFFSLSFSDRLDHQLVGAEAKQTVQDLIDGKERRGCGNRRKRIRADTDASDQRINRRHGSHA